MEQDKDLRSPFRSKTGMIVCRALNAKKVKLRCADQESESKVELTGVLTLSIVVENHPAECRWHR
jgi:hypothetical protein